MSTKNTAPRFEAKEWAAGGAIHMYGTTTVRSFAIEVHTTSDVVGDLLQQAVDKTLARMPFFSQTFVRRKGLYYLADNPLPFEVAESEHLRTLGSAEVNYHHVDVTYWGRRIDFSMNHGLTDGFGITRFIEAVLYHYFCAKDGKEYDSAGIVTDAIPYDPAEVVDVYAEKSNVSTKELKKLADSEKRFRLPELNEKSNKGPQMYRMPVKVKTEDLLSWAKSHGATPATAVSAIMCQAVAAEHPDVHEGVIMASLPYSLRKAIHVEKTLKPCNSAVFLPAHPDEARAMAAGDLARMLREKMRPQQSEEHVQIAAASVNMIVHLGQKLPGYFLKNKLLAMGETHPQDTFTVDYVGSLNTGEYSDQIEDVLYDNADPYLGSIFLVMTEAAGYFTVNFTQTFASDRYEKAFCAKLDELGIAYEEKPADSYLTPKLELPAEQKRR